MHERMTVRPHATILRWFYFFLVRLSPPFESEVVRLRCACARAGCVSAVRPSVRPSDGFVRLTACRRTINVHPTVDCFSDRSTVDANIFMTSRKTRPEQMDAAAWLLLLLLLLWLKR